MAYISAITSHLLYQRRRDETVLFVGHYEDGFYGGTQMAVHESHIIFIFEIRHSTQSPDQGSGFLFGGEFNEKPIEDHGIYIGQVSDVSLYELQAFFDRKNGCFPRSFGYADSNMVKESCRTLENVQMTAGNGVKSPRINAMAHFEKKDRKL